MADSEFEEFRYHFEHIPQHIKATAQTYTLVHDVVLDDSSSSSKESESPAEYDGKDSTSLNENKECGAEFDSGVFTNRDESEESEPSGEGKELEQWPPAQPRPRRRLPEIPKNKKPFNIKSLAEELGGGSEPDEEACHARSLLILKYLRDEEAYFNEADSGNSTAHSPDPPKSPPPYLTGNVTPASTECSSLPFSQLELLEATHRGLHKFVPRHRDEMDLEIGDPIYVQKEADDLWCEGVNLRTGRQGIFPSAYAVDTEYDEFVTATPKVKRERYLLGYLGSVETVCHKGTSVIVQAVTRILESHHKPHQSILEVSDQGLRLVDRSRPKPHRDQPCLDYFYSLKNVSFCAFHPRDHRYLGFITKHPSLQRFACHVFQGSESTRPVAEAIGRAFERFYQKFIETAYPTEDIYIE